MTALFTTAIIIKGLEKAPVHGIIEARTLHNTVLNDIKRHARAAITNDGKMLTRITEKLDLCNKKEVENAKREVLKAKTRLNEVDKMFSKLYEDRCAGVVSERNFKTMTAGYEQEQSELERKISELEYSIDKNRSDVINAERFIQEIKDYAEITELTAALLNKLIERITVDEAEVINGERVQNVRIYYKFIGNLEI